MKDIRIVFMGTPEFAVTPLKYLVERGFNIVAVVTQPDKPAGRGRKLTESPVKQYAKEIGIPVLQPILMKDADFLETLKALNPDLGVVVAFRMLPEVVWSLPRLGTFNLHTSLLPDYRGAAPINRAVINGDSESGVTTFMLDKSMDTGDVLMQRRVEITAEDTAGTLHDKLMFTGAELMIETIEGIVGKTLIPKPQNEPIDRQSRPAPKIFKEDCKIDFSKDAHSINNLIKGLSPYPTAYTDFGGVYGSDISIKIFAARIETVTHTVDLGYVESDGKKLFRIACADGWIYPTDVQLAGKKRMDTESLLRGCRIFDRN